MKDKKTNKFLLITSILSIVILLIGSTFSYFTASSNSEKDALSVSAADVRLGLSVSPRFVNHKLIPTNDKDIMVAYKQECVDDFGFGACLAFDIEVSNYSKMQDVIGSINFTVEKINNLSYLVLDENENIYLDKTKVTGGTDLSLGTNFNLGNGTESIPTSKKFILIIWLTNLEESQELYDAGGKFSASVTYSSIYGGKLTGTINGEKKDLNTTSQLEGGN